MSRACLKPIRGTINVAECRLGLCKGGGLGILCRDSIDPDVRRGDLKVIRFRRQEYRGPILWSTITKDCSRPMRKIFSLYSVDGDVRSIVFALNTAVIQQEIAQALSCEKDRRVICAELRTRMARPFSGGRHLKSSSYHRIILCVSVNKEVPKERVLCLVFSPDEHPGSRSDRP